MAINWLPSCKQWYWYALYPIRNFYEIANEWCIFLFYVTKKRSKSISQLSLWCEKIRERETHEFDHIQNLPFNLYNFHSVCGQSQFNGNFDWIFYDSHIFFLFFFFSSLVGPWFFCFTFEDKFIGSFFFFRLTIYNFVIAYMNSSVDWNRKKKLCLNGRNRKSDVLTLWTGSSNDILEECILWCNQSSTSAGHLCKLFSTSFNTATYILTKLENIYPKQKFFSSVSFSFSHFESCSLNRLADGCFSDTHVLRIKNTFKHTKHEHISTTENSLLFRCFYSFK